MKAEIAEKQPFFTLKTSKFEVIQEFKCRSLSYSHVAANWRSIEGPSEEICQFFHRCAKLSKSSEKPSAKIKSSTHLLLIYTCLWMKISNFDCILGLEQFRRRSRGDQSSFPPLHSIARVYECIQEDSNFSPRLQLQVLIQVL